MLQDIDCHNGSPLFINFKLFDGPFLPTHQMDLLNSKGALIEIGKIKKMAVLHVRYILWADFVVPTRSDHDVVAERSVFSRRLLLEQLQLQFLVFVAINLGQN